MFRNNYHPAFVMGVIGFLTGLFFLYISGLLYNEFVNSFFLFPSPGVDTNSLTQEIYRFFVGTLFISLTFLLASIGIIRRNRNARNIMLGLSIFCLLCVISLCGMMIFKINIWQAQTILYSNFIFTTVTILLSSILIFARKSSDEYFRKNKIDTHKDLLDNI